jgi:hypothetical protein
LIKQKLNKYYVEIIIGYFYKESYDPNSGKRRILHEIFINKNKTSADVARQIVKKMNFYLEIVVYFLLFFSN